MQYTHTHTHIYIYIYILVLGKSYYIKKHHILPLTLMSLSWFLTQPFSPIPRDALLPLVLPALSLSRVLLFVVSWTVAHHTPLSMEFSRQENWSG